MKYPFGVLNELDNVGLLNLNDNLTLFNNQMKSVVDQT
jgi:hypothetical protein